MVIKTSSEIPLEVWEESTLNAVLTPYIAVVISMKIMLKEMYFYWLSFTFPHNYLRVKYWIVFCIFCQLWDTEHSCPFLSRRHFSQFIWNCCITFAIMFTNTYLIFKVAPLCSALRIIKWAICNICSQIKWFGSTYLLIKNAFRFWM